MKKIDKQKEIERDKKYMDLLKLASRKNDYIKNLLNGRYYLARYNMIAEQLISGKIKEKIDGATKTRDYLLAEGALMKMQAIISMRNAHFAKKDLIEEHGLTEKDIQELEDDYYNGKIIREDYGEEYKPKDKARFV